MSHLEQKKLNSFPFETSRNSFYNFIKRSHTHFDNPLLGIRKNRNFELCCVDLKVV